MTWNRNTFLASSLPLLELVYLTIVVKVNQFWSYRINIGSSTTRLRNRVFYFLIKAPWSFDPWKVKALRPSAIPNSEPLFSNSLKVS